MKLRSMLVCAATLAAALQADLWSAERVPLLVDMGGVKLGESVPVRTGVPFSQGALKSPRNARLVAGGNEIAMQARTLAVWPDGSVKWLLVDFVGKDGDAPELEYGAGVKRRTVAGALKAETTRAAVTLDTGVIRLTVRRDGSGCIDELAFDRNGNGRYEATEAVIGPAGESEQRYFLDFLHRPRDEHYRTWGNHMPGGVVGRSTVQITELKLEEAGPLRAVILIRGKHKVPKLAARIADQIRYEGESDFTVRIHAFRASGELRVQAHFVLDGVPDDDFVRAWGVRLPVGRGMKFTTPAGGPGEMGDGMARLSPNGATPFAALTQTSADAFKVWASDADRAAQNLVAGGKRSAGWVDFSNDEWGVTVGTRWFWRRWPNAIHYDGAKGELAAMFWPPEMGVMDVRRYARYEWGVGETGAGDMDLTALAPVAAKGIANTKEIRLVFHRGAADLARTTAEYQAFNANPVAKAAPGYYAGTRALGYYAARAEGKHGAFEKQVASFIGRFAKGQEEFRWYGMWDYGDFQQRRGDAGQMNAHRHGRWENDWGRWGWAQNDGAGRHCKLLLLQFLRTGERKYFDLGEAMVCHQVDVDFLETREFPWDFSVIRKIPVERTKGPWWDVRGCSHRHGVQHWSCGYVGVRGGNVVGQRIYYYLTGDGRALDVLDILAEAGMVKFGLGGREKIAQRLGHSGGPTGQSATTAAIYYAWERTGDKVYRDALKTLVKNGGSYGAAWGGQQALVAYADLTGDEAAKQEIVKRAKAKVAYSKGRRKVWSWPQSSIAIVQAGYRLSGDAELGELLAKMIVGGSEMRGKGVNANYGIEMPYAIEALNIHGGL